MCLHVCSCPLQLHGSALPYSAVPAAVASIPRKPRRIRTNHHANPECTRPVHSEEDLTQGSPAHSSAAV